MLALILSDSLISIPRPRRFVKGVCESFLKFFEKVSGKLFAVCGGGCRGGRRGIVYHIFGGLSRGFAKVFCFC